MNIDDAYFVVDLTGHGHDLINALVDSGIDNDHIIINSYGNNKDGWGAFTDDIKSSISCIQLAAQETGKEYAIYGINCPEEGAPALCKSICDDNEQSAFKKTVNLVGSELTAREEMIDASIIGGKDGMNRLAAERGYDSFQSASFKSWVPAQERKEFAQIAEAPGYEKAEALAAKYYAERESVSGIDVIGIPEKFPRGRENVDPEYVTEAIKESLYVNDREAVLNVQNENLIYVGPEEVTNKLHGQECEDGIGKTIKSAGEGKFTEEEVENCVRGVSNLKSKLEISTNQAVTHNAVESDQSMGGDMVNAVTGVGQAAAETTSEAVENAPDNYNVSAVNEVSIETQAGENVSVKESAEQTAVENSVDNVETSDQEIEQATVDQPSEPVEETVEETSIDASANDQETVESEMEEDGPEMEMEMD